MSVKLFLQAVFKFALGMAAVGLLLFLPVGTADYPKGWLLMALLFIPMFSAGVIMMVKNPELLKKRLNLGEEQVEQRVVIKLSGLMFIVGFVSAGLSFRFELAVLPDWVSWVGAALFLTAYLIYGEVLRENTYLSRTVEVQEGQKVTDTG